MCAILSGCDRPQSPAAGADAPQQPTVVSLVPAATDLLVGMGLAERLIAISNWDPERPETAGLPRVGDYRTQDWEQITSLRPAIMIVQYRPDKMPPGLEQRANSAGIVLLNVRINRLDEVFTTIEQLGEAMNAPARAADASRRLRTQLNSVGARVTGKPPVTTLIVRTPSGLDVVGGGNFMDDLLALAGGKNVIETGENSYPTIDREMLLALDPQVILQLLPGASPQEINQAHAFWANLPQLRAVKGGRVHILTESYLLLPGYSVGQIAEAFAEKLHSGTTSRERS